MPLSWKVFKARVEKALREAGLDENANIEYFDFAGYDEECGGVEVYVDDGEISAH